MPRKKAATRRQFGSVRKLPSGRFQARFTHPVLGEIFKAPRTFSTKGDAEGWLSTEQRSIELGTWVSPAEQEKAAEVEAERDSLTVKVLCDRWLSAKYLKRSTAQSHRSKLNLRVLNTALADEPIATVDRARIVSWWSEVQERWPDTANTNAAAYKRLHTAFQYAIDELEVLTENPVRIKGAGKPPRPETRDRPLITLAEAELLADNMSDRLQVPMQLLLWCGLRIGELLELRRKDLHGLAGDGTVTLRIRRTAQRMEDPKTKKQVMVPFDTPKTEAGNRDIDVPADVAAKLREHCRDYVAADAEALIVTTRTGAQMMDTTWRSRMTSAKEAAGRTDVTPHDCRRFYGTMLVTNGVDFESARLLMGHETVEQLMEYQRAADGHGKRAAAVLDGLRIKAKSADAAEGTKS